MSLSIVPSFITQDREHIVYNRELFNDFSANLFIPESLSCNGQIIGSAPGRGETLFFQYENRQFALRHFCRGGFVSRIVRDHYFSSPFIENRAWAEWHVLVALIEKGLPAPIPAAARVVKKGIFYQADLITELLPCARSLASVLENHELDSGMWRKIGETIARFHAVNLWHADLNAHNILLVNDDVYLIDFDRARFVTNTKLLRGNVERLQRSFEKLNSLLPHFSYNPDDFSQLLVGYQQSLNK